MTKVSSLTIALRTLKALLLSFETLLVLASLGLLAWDRARGSLFGREASDSLIGLWSFAPSDPFANHGVTLFTYPLIHQSVEHLAASGVILILLGIRLAKRVPRHLRVLNCGIASVSIALSFSLPFAPPATGADRVFGLSALAHAYLAASLILKPTLLATCIFLALVMVTIWGAPSALTLWGHGAGFTIGLFLALLFRLARSRNSSAASA